MKKYFVIASLMLFAVFNANAEKTLKNSRNEDGKTSINIIQSELSKEQIINLSNKVLNDAFGKYNVSRSARITNYKIGDENEGNDHNTFYMEPASIDVVGNTVYLLTEGMSKAATMYKGCHKCGGLVGMFVFQPKDNGYNMIVKKYEIMGSWGNPPYKRNFVQIGPDSYGWRFRRSVTEQGYTVSASTFYAIHEDTIKNIGDIPRIFDNSGAVGDKKATSLESTITFNTKSTDRPFYPIKARVTGKEAGKKITPRTYIIKFDDKKEKYLVTNDYPIEKP